MLFSSSVSSVTGMGDSPQLKPLNSAAEAEELLNSLLIMPQNTSSTFDSRCLPLTFAGAVKCRNDKSRCMLSFEFVS